MPAFRRVLLKLSGEALAGGEPYGIHPPTLLSIAEAIRDVRSDDVDVAVVIGAGNIFRGVAGSAQGMDRATADYMGMVATVINCLALQDALEKLDVTTRVQSAIAMQEVAEPYIRRRALRHLEKGRVVIFAAGTGNPFFTTDTTAALRAAEMRCEVILKATKVDGVYDSDPLTNPNAVRYERVSHHEALTQRLHVMDSTALSLCMDNKLPIVVFSLRDPANIRRLCSGEPVGTLITAD